MIGRISADRNGETAVSEENKIMDNMIEHHQLKIISANANSLKNKIMSLKFTIEQLKPHLVVIQETKLKKKSLVTLQGYRCFDTVRGDSGGGLLVACLAALDPVMVYEGDSECEVLVVKLSVDKKQIRIIAGYGPQECAPVIVRETYRNTVEDQVVRATLAGASVIIAEDANAT